MGNTVLKPTVIAKEAAFQVVNNLVMAKRANRQFVNEFKKKGDTVTFRKPVRYTVTDGATLTAQDTTENSDTLVINKRKHVGMQFSTQDLTLTIEEFSERYIKPATIVLGNQLDADGCALYTDVYNTVGTAGTAPASFAPIANAGQKMDEFAVPPDSRSLILNPAGTWALLNGNTTNIFQPAFVKDVLVDAKIGRIANFDLYSSAQNIKKQTAGVPGGTPVVNGANQTGATINVNGMTATTGTYKAGDIVTFAGCNAVNPVSKQDTGSLQQFVVTANATADGTGAATLSISPSITVSGPYQTVTASPTASGAVTLTASHTANLAFHKNAFSLVTVPLEKPDGAVWSAAETYEGISIRIVKDYNITNDMIVTRLDILYGWKTVYPELACRVMG